MAAASALHVMHVMEATAGGSRKHLRQLVEGLRRADVAVDVVLSPVRADAEFESDCLRYRELGCGVDLLRMRRLPAPSDVRAWLQVRRLIRRRQPQIVHTHCAKAGLIGRLAAVTSGCAVRTVHTPHSFFFQGLSRGWAAVGVVIERVLARRTDALLCIAAAEAAEAARRRIRPCRETCVAANGVPATFASSLLPRARARQALKLPPDAFAIAFFSRLVRKKDHALALRAVAGLPAAHRARTRLVIAGEGEEETRLRQLAEKLGVADSVIFAGYVPMAERYLSGMDLAVLPSAYEGLAYQFIEALAAGVPLIASDVPGNRPRAADSPVLYVQPGACDALTAEIRQLMDEPAAREKLAREGRVWVMEHFSLARQVEQVIACYRRILRGRAAAADGPDAGA